MLDRMPSLECIRHGGLVDSLYEMDPYNLPEHECDKFQSNNPVKVISFV